SYVLRVRLFLSNGQMVEAVAGRLALCAPDELEEMISWPDCSQVVPFGSISSGRETQKVEPRPSSLVKPIEPPIKATNPLLVAKPKPVPPKQRFIELSTCINLSNSAGYFSVGMPIPVSV